MAQLLVVGGVVEGSGEEVGVVLQEEGWGYSLKLGQSGSLHWYNMVRINSLSFFNLFNTSSVFGENTALWVLHTKDNFHYKNINGMHVCRYTMHCM